MKSTNHYKLHRNDQLNSIQNIFHIPDIFIHAIPQIISSNPSSKNPKKSTIVSPLLSIKFERADRDGQRVSIRQSLEYAKKFIITESIQEVQIQNRGDLIIKTILAAHLQLSLLNQPMEELQQKIRRSSQLLLPDTFRDYLAYANMVADEEQVYLYMEENQIGLYQPQFWVAYLTHHHNRAQYTEFLSMLRKVKQRNFKFQLEKTGKYHLIEQIENEVEKQLEKMLRKKIKGRRSALQYQILTLTKVEKETRKIGKIQIYIDPDCRYNYRLEDLVEFVTTRLKDQCELIKNTYIRRNSHKPLSFIRKTQNQIQKWALELIHPRRLSLQAQRMSLNLLGHNRKSFVGRQSMKMNLATPCVKSEKKEKRESRSVKIKKKIDRSSSKYFSYGTPAKKDNGIDNPQLCLDSQIRERTDSIRKEIVRGKECLSSSNDDISETTEEINKNENQRNHKRKSSQDLFYPEQNKAEYTEDLSKQDDKNNAFILQSRYQNSVLNQEPISQSLTNLRLEKQLQETIKEVQLQRHESQQTCSQIDSNKQNNRLLSQIDGSESELNWMTGLESKKNKDISEKQRKMLKTLFKKNENQSQLQNQSCSSEQHESSAQVYQQLLECLSDKKCPKKKKMKKSRIIYSYTQQNPQISNNLDKDSTSENRQQLDSFEDWISQTSHKNPGYILRISEQKSYSHSQTKCKNRRNLENS